MLIESTIAYVYEKGQYFCIRCKDEAFDCLCDEKRADERLFLENSGIEDSWYEEF